MTQFLIEEAIYERIESVERQVRNRASGLTAENMDLGGIDPGSLVSPGEQQKMDHNQRMAALTGGGG